MKLMNQAFSFLIRIRLSFLIFCQMLSDIKDAWAMQHGLKIFGRERVVLANPGTWTQWSSFLRSFHGPLVTSSISSSKRSLNLQ